MEWIEAFKIWFISLGDNYGVNPYIFGAIYVGAIPFFTISVGYIVKNYRQKKSIALPVMSASFCFVSAYLYLMIAGENVPWWVYGIVIALLVYGGYSTYIKVKKQVAETEDIHE
jgi:O-antigen/teichoic acid export membrane protein